MIIHRFDRRSLLESAIWALPLLQQELAGRAAQARTSVKWVAMYGPVADERALSSYDIVVLDPGFRGSVSSVREKGARVCAYLSLAEIRMTDPLYKEVSPKALLEANSAWPDTLRVDVRNAGWKQLVPDHALPRIVELGFDGVFLDTLDTPIYLEQMQPKNNKGMCDAGIDLVLAIRSRYPSLFLMLNRGYSSLPRLIMFIDCLVMESLLTVLDEQTGKWRWSPIADVVRQVATLAPLVQRRPEMPLLSLDYWNMTDDPTVREIYRRERTLSHSPYVANRLLDQIFPEPEA